MEKFEFEVGEEESGQRVDKFLAASFSSVKSEITRSKIQHFIDDGLVLSDGKSVKNASGKVKVGQKFSVEIPAPKSMDLEAKEIDFEIIFEDDDLLVINKPSGLTVHPGAGNQDNTLVNGLLFTHKGKLSEINGEFRPGIVHRLDKDTSGLMLVAKNDFTHQKLSKDLQDHDIKRNYLAIIFGVLNPRKGKIDNNIGRSRSNRLKMAIAKRSGRRAVTNYETKKTLFSSFASIVECRLETGRTHQIRVHLEHMKHSIIGDQTYNSCKKLLPQDMSDEDKEFVNNFLRQALHSYKIAFIHPRSEEEMKFEIGLPDDMKELVEKLTESE